MPYLPSALDELLDAMLDAQGKGIPMAAPSIITPAKSHAGDGRLIAPCGGAAANVVPITSDPRITWDGRK